MKILMKYSLLFKNQKTNFLRWPLISFTSRIIAQSNPVVVRQILSIKLKSGSIWGVVCGPEVTQIINEFEESMKQEVPEEDDPNLHLHHEDSATYKKRFSSDVRTLSICETIPKNSFCIWCTPEIDTEKPFAPSNSDISKTRNECEHKSEIAKIDFGNEILNTP